MKPIILDMEEMSDSEELYRTKPKSMVVYALYSMFALIIVVGVVTSFLRVDSVVKGNGVLRDSDVKDIIKGIPSKITSCSVREMDEFSDGRGVYAINGNTISPTRCTSKGQEYKRDVPKFHVELYVSSYDIGGIEEGQEVKFELAAYPASKYGYCKGVVCNISKDAVVDERIGESYYVVTVRSDTIVDDARQKKIILRNGMPCKGNIVVGKKTIMSYILEKI